RASEGTCAGVLETDPAGNRGKTLSGPCPSRQPSWLQGTAPPVPNAVQQVPTHPLPAGQSAGVHLRLNPALFGQLNLSTVQSTVFVITPFVTMGAGQRWSSRATSSKSQNNVGSC